jgi:3-methyladenine DNA glycosylase AlkD
MSETPTAAEFVNRLQEHRSEEELAKIRRRFPDRWQSFLGVRMGTVFSLAKENAAMPIAELDRLLDSEIHEARVGALKIMGYQAARRSTPESRRAELYELYLRRLDRIDNWDLVDLSGHTVVGGHLLQRPRDVLYELAAGDDPWRRRLAIWATMAFVRQGELDDTFAIAALLAEDEHEHVQTVVGGLLRSAGDSDIARLRGFLDAHAARMGRTALRYALEHLAPEERAHYRNMRTASR